jgi:nucleoside-diphosphate-sugar epimerase
MSAGIIHSVAPGCDIRIGSITMKDDSQKLLSDCDRIIHCALAMVSGKPKRSRRLNKAMIDNFSDLEGLRQFIHLSSIAVYPEGINRLKFPKSTFERPRPDNEYGRSKLLIEQYVQRMCKSKRLDYYILRLGHVIGARMDRSREILELAQTPQFRLPFNGDLPSNTVHVEHLASLIIELLSKPLSGGTYNVADENRTWRQVFDWHSKSVTLPPVQGMTKEISIRHQSLCRSKSMLMDIVRWVRALPFFGLINYPAVFENAYKLLTILPESISIKLSTAYKRLDVGRQISAAIDQFDAMPLLSPVYFLDAMPGQYLKLPVDTHTNDPALDDLAIQLRRWHRRFAAPRWLPDSVDALIEGKLSN